MTTTRYFVTGGAGFIGSHIAEALLNQGESVIVFDNLATGNEKNLAALNLTLYNFGRKGDQEPVL